MLISSLNWEDVNGSTYNNNVQGRSWMSNPMAIEELEDLGYTDGAQFILRALEGATLNPFE